MIRKATQDDIESLVYIHIDALPGELLTSLGESFLTKQFYPKVFQSANTLTLVNEGYDGLVNAFCIFAYKSDALTSQIVKNKLFITKYLLKNIFNDVTLIPKVIGYLKGYRLQLSPYYNIEYLKKITELYLIVTHPAHQGKGIGSKIIEEGLNIVFQKYTSCLVKTSSERAKQFYLRHRFKQIGVEYHWKKEITLLIRNYL